MNLKHIFYIFLLGVLTLTLVLPTISCAPSKEKQEIINYIETMMPVMSAHADWYEDQNRIFRTKEPNYYELMSDMEDLLYRIQDIYMDVDSSLPPVPLREFKRKWSQECELCILAMQKFMEGLARYDADAIYEAQNIAFEANRVKTEATEEMLDVLEQYDIDISEYD